MYAIKHKNPPRELSTVHTDEGPLISAGVARPGHQLAQALVTFCQPDTSQSHLNRELQLRKCFYQIVLCCSLLIND